MPPDLAALASTGGVLLQSTALRLHPADMARVEALRSRLGMPAKGAVLRGLVLTGLRLAEQSQQSEVVIHD